MTEIEIMPVDQLWRAYDWNNGAAQGWDRDAHFAQLQRPDWVNYQIKKDGMIVGCVSLELLDAVTVGFHVALDIGRLRLKETRALLVGIGKTLFGHGIQNLRAHIPKENRAARALALVAGFSRLSATEEHDILGMTAQDYFNDPARWDAML